MHSARLGERSGRPWVGAVGRTRGCGLVVCPLSAGRRPALPSLRRGERLMRPLHRDTTSTDAGPRMLKVCLRHDPEHPPCIRSAARPIRRAAQLRTFPTPAWWSHIRAANRFPLRRKMLRADGISVEGRRSSRSPCWKHASGMTRPAHVVPKARTNRAPPNEWDGVRVCARGEGGDKICCRCATQHCGFARFTCLGCLYTRNARAHCTRHCHLYVVRGGQWSAGHRIWCAK